MIKEIKRLKIRLFEQERPVKFLLSRILWKTKLCSVFIIKFPEYKIKFYPTALSASYWVNPKYSSQDFDFFRHYIKKGDKVIDVGANIGTLTLLASYLVGNTGMVHSIEAFPRTFNFLQKNIELNHYTNIQASNLAIGDRSDMISFSNQRSDDQNCIQINVKCGSIKVPMKKLDDINHFDKIELLKIDVEGFELYVLKGATNVLNNTACILLESDEALYTKYSYALSDIIRLLNQAGFQLYRRQDNYMEILPIDYKSNNNENLYAIKDINSFLERTGYIL